MKWRRAFRAALPPRPNTSRTRMSIARSTGPRDETRALAPAHGTAALRLPGRGGNDDARHRELHRDLPERREVRRRKADVRSIGRALRTGRLRIEATGQAARGNPRA